MKSKREGWAGGVSVKIKSKTAYGDEWHGLWREGSKDGRLRKQLENSLKLVKDAEERLRQS